MKILGYCVKLKNVTTSKGRGYDLSGAWTALESALKMLLNLFFF